MTLKSALRITAAMLLTTSLVNCGGGGGSISTGGVYFTHEELAREFAERVYTDVGADLELVKANTHQNDYIVVYDWDLDTYDAYYLGSYNVGESLFDYLYDYDSYFYYDLDFIGGDDYQHWDTGLIFEKTSSTHYDEEKVAALKETLHIKKAANNLVSSYGIPEDKALELSKMSAQLKNTDSRTLTDEDYKELAIEAIGVDPMDYVKAFEIKAKTGDNTMLSSLVEKSAKSLRVTPQQVNKIIDKVATDLLNGN